MRYRLAAGRGWWSGGALVAVVAALGVRGTTLAAGTLPAGLAVTLSGVPAAPFGERAARVGGHAVGVQFRAPRTAELARIYTHWRRAAAGCEVALHEGVTPGVVVARGAIEAARGWVATPLATSLRQGLVYHLVFTCSSRRARLSYVLDADRTALDRGLWQLERARGAVVHKRARPAAPLFTLAFADGTMWGQPYRGVRHRPAVRICGGQVVRETIVARSSITLSGVALPIRAGRRASLEFSLSGQAGTPVLTGRLVPTGRRATGTTLFRPEATAGALTLAANAPYTLTLSAPRVRRCLRERALFSDLPLGAAASGFDARDLALSRDGGRTWTPAASTLGVTLLPVPTDGPRRGGGGGSVTPGICGDGIVQAPREECDGDAADACPGRCTSSCTCTPPPPSCGDGVVQPGEECDGASDAACPGQCSNACGCVRGPTRAYRSIYGSGYFGVYDARTVPVWPQRLGLLLGGVDVQGPLVAHAKSVAAAAGNTDATFIFYFSLTDMDSRCHCYDQRFYEGFQSGHPEWILENGGSNVSTNNGIGRLFATDIGNLDYVDAWADWALDTCDSQGWDGVFADNIFRGNFSEWSAPPVNPRTGQLYTSAEYRADMLQALTRLRDRFHARGKIVVGNHAQAWNASTFADPLEQAEVATMDGVEIEDCLFRYDGSPHTESEFIDQLRYLDFANRRGVRTVCSGASASIGDPRKRWYMLASYLLTKEGLSSLSEFNNLSQWFDGMTTDLGAPAGSFYCLDPDAGFTTTADCPSPGNIYGRAWEKGRVLVNPSPSRTVTVPLGETLHLRGDAVTEVTLAPRDGAVLTR